MSDARVSELFEAIANRLAEEPDLEHFLSWWGGTLEYWIEIVASVVGKRYGWTAHSEIPYVTGSPSAGSKTNVKWADGIVISDDGWAVILEIKTVPMKAKLGGAIEQVPKDFASLLSIDWPRTISYTPKGIDNYTDPEWWFRRSGVSKLWGLNILLVHGPAPLPAVQNRLDEGLARGVRSLKSRFKDESPIWLRELDSTIRTPSNRQELMAASSLGLLLGWSARLTTVELKGGSD